MYEKKVYLLKGSTTLLSLSPLHTTLHAIGCSDRRREPIKCHVWCFWILISSYQLLLQLVAHTIASCTKAFRVEEERAAAAAPLKHKLITISKTKFDCLRFEMSTSFLCWIMLTFEIGYFFWNTLYTVLCTQYKYILEREGKVLDGVENGSNKG